MRRNTAETHTVSFRLDDHLFRLLGEAGTAVGHSPGEHARRLVRAALTNEHNYRVLDHLDQLRKEVKAMKAHLRLATIALLTDAGHASLEDAERWVTEYFGPT